MDETIPNNVFRSFSIFLLLMLQVESIRFESVQGRLDSYPKIVFIIDLISIDLLFCRQLGNYVLLKIDPLEMLFDSNVFLKIFRIEFLDNF